jgi:hypothetical protein
MVNKLRATWVPLCGFVFGFGLLVGIGIFPVQAQIADRQVNALVEALRQAAPVTGRQDDQLYSDWQIKPDNIPRWSRSCLGRELTPTQFENSPDTARSVVTCVMRDVLRDEYRASNNNETLAIQRSAAWWMTGDPGQYNSSTILPYIQRVVSAYRQQLGTAPTTAPSPSSSPPPSSPASPSTSSTPATLPDYDRYMRAGYAATQRKDYDTALLYFRRALDERPNDTYAQQAVRNVETYRGRNLESTPASSPTPGP